MKKEVIRLKTLFLLLFLVCCGAVNAQVNVSGTVTDAHKEPLVGANVIIKGTTTGAVADYDGHFTLTVPSIGTILQISFIGYKSVELPASAEPMLIVLEEDTEMLEDVVVIGYGGVKKSDLTGSVNAFKPDDFNKGIQTSAQDAMVGKIAGVNVVSSSGAPGAGATIRIRSGASLSASNDPLIVIDGVPVDNSSIEGSSNLIGSINPNDIETFTVLKDASATAIYGSRASNGVIVITTKKGRMDSKLRFTYSGNFSVSTPSDKLEVLSAREFKEFVPTVTGVPANAEFGESATDWQDKIYRTTFGHEHNLSMSGSIPEVAPFRVSVGYTEQNGIIRKNAYERYTVSGAIAPSFFNKHLTIDMNVKLSYEDNDKIDDSVVGNALRYDPTRPVKTGSKTASTDPGLGYFIWTNGNSPMAIQTDNPVAQLELQSKQNKVLRSIGNAAVNYKLHGFEDLQLNVNLGYDVLKSDNDEYTPELAGMMYTSNQKDGTGLVYNSTQKKRNYLLDLYANYTHTFAEKHSVSLMGGYGWQHFWKKFDSTSDDTEGKQLSTPKHYESEYYLLSFYGRLNYTFDNRYMLTATLRSDASSRFKKNNRWGLFPSVALAWKVKQEKFLTDSDMLSDLKVRLSYGKTGQQDILNDYPWMTTFSVSYPESSYQFGNDWHLTYRPNGYDEDIKWETTETYNAGLDFGFLNNRIYGSVDYYQRYTNDLLNTINVISGTNYSSVITTNIGKMENKGVELSLNAVPVRTEDWEWSIGMNYTWNDSKITKLNVIDSESNFVQTGAISGTGKTVQVFMVGKRPYTFYLCKQAYDKNGKPLEGQYIQPDGSISPTETKYASDKSALPSSYLGFNTHLSFRNWDFAVSGHGAFGAYVYNYVAADQYIQSVYSDQGSFSNILRSTRYKGFQQQQLYSDYFLEKADFFRIDNITLGYNFKKLWNDDSSLRLTLGVQNVGTLTGYSGVDPEIYNGIDKQIYQRPRVYTLGVNLTF